MSLVILLLKGLGALALIAVVVVLGLYFIRGITMKDWRFLFQGLAIKRFQKQAAISNMLLSDLWEQQVRKHGRDRPALIFEGKPWTNGDVDDEANRIAHWLLSLGFKTNDNLALLMENRIDYCSTWLGAAKVGVRTALINNNLKNESLEHSILVSECKAVLFSTAETANLSDVAETLAGKMKGLQFYIRGGEAKFATSVDAAIAKQPSTAPPKDKGPQANGVRTKDSVMFIYTSGTTGKPKAAKISHNRFLVASKAFSTFGQLTTRDRVYCCLPLYHSAAGIVGLGTLFQSGSTVVLRKKFSKRAFWTDVRENKCTVVQYIGEVARYALAEPPGPDDHQHSVRLAMGNGMRPDVWPTFQKRFGIPKIMEFYAATEGAGALVNTEGKEAAIGFISPLVSMIFPAKIFKYDMNKEDLVRDDKGHCVPCKPGEPGEFLMRIEESAGVRNYQGYTDEKDSKKKVARNVVKDGDEWFKSGDLLRQDNEGFVFFVDRIGDTFRWKGENVATTMVAEVMTLFDDLKNAQVNVYGVEVPGNEGRCGMAAIGIEGGDAKVDLDGLAKHVSKRLESYSRPFFLRFVPLMDMTGTFKYKKVELRNEGFNPDLVTDALYFLHPDRGTYQKVTKQVFADIGKGVYRF